MRRRIGIEMAEIRREATATKAALMAKYARQAATDPDVDDARLRRGIAVVMGWSVARVATPVSLEARLAEASAGSVNWCATSAKTSAHTSIAPQGADAGKNPGKELP
jgi:hypothetical protein